MPNGTPTQTEPPVEIKTMPEQFYFKKIKMPKGEGGGPKSTLIIVMVMVVLALMAGAAYLFTQSLVGKPKTTPQPTNANVAVNVPANVPTNIPVNVPPAQICGNGICETGETSTTCAADCPALPPPPTPAPLPMGPDIDKDGLTDTEETLYSADSAKADTDSDGYPDGLELINLYNPIGVAPQKLEETNLVKIYTNQAHQYSIFYPASWSARALDETQREIMFTSTTGEFMQVIVEDNPTRTPLMDWYLAEAPGTNPAEVGTAATKNGLIGIKSPDGLTAYFVSGDKIYAISYNVGIKTELNYKSTFEMMVKSFKLLP